MKKCLCCMESFEKVVDLKNHYINYHSVDETKYFLKKLFTRNRNFCLSKSFQFDFFDSQSVVSDFLTVFENNFVPFNGVVSPFKCSFTMINHQPPRRVGFVDILTVVSGKLTFIVEFILMIL